MSKGIYIGVNRKAYSEYGTLSNADLSKFFTVTNGSPYSWNITDDSESGIGLKPANVGINSSTATITFTAVKNLTNVIIRGAYFTQVNYDKITLIVADTTILNAKSGSSGQAERWSGNLNKGQTITLTYVKNASVHASSESSTYFIIRCDDININITAKDNDARKVKKCYIGVNKKAHRVRKGYIGVNGIAKKFFGGELIKLNDISIEPLNGNVEHGIATTSNNNYAIFFGGAGANSSVPLSNYYNCYNKNFTRSEATSYKCYHAISFKTPSYAVFMGGYTTYGNYAYVASSGFALDDNLTKTTVSPSIQVGEAGAGSNSIGGIIVGGTTSNAISTNKAYFYDDNLTRSVIASISYEKSWIASTTINDYVIFAGGYGGGGDTFYSNVEIYDNNCSLITHTLKLDSAGEYQGANNKEYALFADGHINIFDKNLVKHASLTDNSYGGGTVSFDDIALMNRVGPYDSSNYRYTFELDSVDQNLTIKTVEAPSPSRSFASATLDYYAFIGPGGDCPNTMDVYEY